MNFLYIELITDSTKLAMSGSNAMCKLVIPDNLWQIEADKGQLSQVISNLIINAVQAMPEEGNIKIWTVNSNVTEKDSLPLQEGNYIKIAIEDNGTGISQEHLQMIFDPYFTTKQKGSGLGLATAYSIVKKHDGHIAVESEIGVGTTFSIYLPASEKKTPKQSVLRDTEKALLEPVEEKNEEKPVINKGRILLMDDEFIISHLGRHCGRRVQGGRAREPCGITNLQPGWIWMAPWTPPDNPRMAPTTGRGR